MGVKVMAIVCSITEFSQNRPMNPQAILQASWQASLTVPGLMLGSTHRRACLKHGLVGAFVRRVILGDHLICR